MNLAYKSVAVLTLLALLKIYSQQRIGFTNKEHIMCGSADPLSFYCCYFSKIRFLFSFSLAFVKEKKVVNLYFSK